MSQQLKTHCHFLELLRAAKPKQRRALLKTITNDQLDALCNCAYNFLKGNIRISPQRKARLVKDRYAIRQLAAKTVSRKRKRTLLNQRGGFLSALLGAILPPVLGKIIGL